MAGRGLDGLRNSYDNRTVASDPGRTPRRRVKLSRILKGCLCAILRTYGGVPQEGAFVFDSDVLSMRCSDSHTTIDDLSLTHDANAIPEVCAFTGTCFLPSALPSLVQHAVGQHAQHADSLVVSQVYDLLQMDDRTEAYHLSPSRTHRAADHPAPASTSSRSTRDVRSTARAARYARAWAVSACPVSAPSRRGSSEQLPSAGHPQAPRIKRFSRGSPGASRARLALLRLRFPSVNFLRLSPLPRLSKRISPNHQVIPSTPPIVSPSLIAPFSLHVKRRSAFWRRARASPSSS